MSKSLCFSHSPQGWLLSQKSTLETPSAQPSRAPGAAHPPPPFGRPFNPVGSPLRTKPTLDHATSGPPAAAPTTSFSSPQPPQAPGHVLGLGSAGHCRSQRQTQAGPPSTASYLPSSRPWGESREADPGPGQPSCEATSHGQQLKELHQNPKPVDSAKHT